MPAIDDVLRFVREHDGIAPVQAEVIAQRLKHKPNEAELTVAKAMLEKREQQKKAAPGA